MTESGFCFAVSAVIPGSCLRRSFIIIIYIYYLYQIWINLSYFFLFELLPVLFRHALFPSHILPSSVPPIEPLKPDLSNCSLSLSLLFELGFAVRAPFFEERVVEMAAKRFFSDSGSDPAQPPNKQMRTRPTFASWATLSSSIHLLRIYDDLILTYGFSDFGFDSKRTRGRIMNIVTMVSCVFFSIPLQGNRGSRHGEFLAALLQSPWTDAPESGMYAHVCPSKSVLFSCNHLFWKSDERRGQIKTCLMRIVNSHRIHDSSHAIDHHQPRLEWICKSFREVASVLHEIK